MPKEPVPKLQPVLRDQQIEKPRQPVFGAIHNNSHLIERGSGKLPLARDIFSHLYPLFLRVSQGFFGAAAPAAIYGNE